MKGKTTNKFLKEEKGVRLLLSSLTKKERGEFVLNQMEKREGTNYCCVPEMKGRVVGNNQEGRTVLD